MPLFTKLMRLLKPITFLIGKCNIPHKKQITQQQIDEILSVINPGDIILSHTKFCASNLFISGYWKHAAMYCFYNVVEAVDPVVRTLPARKFFTSKDAIIVLRFSGMTNKKKDQIAKEAAKHIGKKYDYYFQKSIKRLYCSELVKTCYESVLGRNIFRYDKILGQQVLQPDAIAKDPCFETVILVRNNEAKIFRELS